MKCFQNKFKPFQNLCLQFQARQKSKMKTFCWTTLYTLTRNSRNIWLESIKTDPLYYYYITSKEIEIHTPFQNFIFYMNKLIILFRSANSLHCKRFDSTYRGIFNDEKIKNVLRFERSIRIRKS